MNVLGDILSLTIIFTVPLLLVALGGMFSERSGVVNIALEGIMVIGALVSFLYMSKIRDSAFAAATPVLATLTGVAVAAVAGMVFALLLAFASIHLKADQTIGGTALNMFAPAFAILLTWTIQGQGQTAIYTPPWARISPTVFGADLQNLNFFQRVFLKEFFITTPLAIFILILVIIVLYKTKFGLRLRSCGEHPQAADSVGVNVYFMRYAGVGISGLLGGIGGFAYALAAGAGFSATVSGYGFLALAVMIFGNWKPLRIVGAASLFAFFKVISAMATAIPFLPSFQKISGGEYIYLMVPYVVTMIVLAFTSKRSRAPKASGIPYDKGAR
ncbi:MAG: ABC transporter permease [Clostridia bacterium]|nr:ABC transporter permease [Clostridia bacterium]